jgi:hypothetical protein
MKGGGGYEKSSHEIEGSTRAARCVVVEAVVSVKIRA